MLYILRVETLGVVPSSSEFNARPAPRDVWRFSSVFGSEALAEVRKRSVRFCFFLRCGAVVLYSRVATWRKGPKTSEVWGFEEGERFMCAAKNGDTNTQPEKAGPNAKTGAYKQEMCPGNALNTALRRFFEHPVLAYWHLYREEGFNFFGGELCAPCARI